MMLTTAKLRCCYINHISVRFFWGGKKVLLSCQKCQPSSFLMWSVCVINTSNICIGNFSTITQNSWFCGFLFKWLDITSKLDWLITISVQSMLCYFFFFLVHLIAQTCDEWNENHLDMSKIWQLCRNYIFFSKAIKWPWKSFPNLSATWSLK